MTYINNTVYFIHILSCVCSAVKYLNTQDTKYQITEKQYLVRSIYIAFYNSVFNCHLNTFIILCI